MSELADEAHDLLERHDYAGARIVFREAALRLPPTATLLTNLAIAEAEERLWFRKALIEAHSDALVVLLDEVDRLMDARYSRLAVKRCNELLAKPGLSPKEAMVIRDYRLRAAAAARQASHYAEDFRHVLDYHRENTTILLKKIRYNMIRRIASLTDPSFAGSLAKIRDWLGDERDLVVVIDAKITELEAIRRLKAIAFETTAGG